MSQQSIRRLGQLVAGLLGVVAALGAVFVVGMRRKTPAVQRAVRVVNKAFWNPRSMKDAGTPGAYAAVVHHVGRRSGVAYQTPVVPVKTEDGFVIALPYGTNADWVQNVLAAGRASMVYEGETYYVDRPEVMATDDVDVYFDESERWSHRAFRVDQALRLYGVDAAIDSVERPGVTT